MLSLSPNRSVLPFAIEALFNFKILLDLLFCGILVDRATLSSLGKALTEYVNLKKKKNSMFEFNQNIFKQEMPDY